MIFKPLMIIDTVMLVIVALVMLLGVIRTEESELTGFTLTIFTLGIVGNILAIALIWM